RPGRALREGSIVSAHANVFDDLQANIVRSAKLRCARYEMFRIQDVEALKSFLLAHRDLVSTESPAVRVAPKVTLGLTFPGLVALGLSEDRQELLPESFVEGMASRAQILGDVGRSAPECWEGRFGTGAIHGVVMVGSPAADSRALARLWHRHV